jgi:2,3-bisphosphoglycerate-independent phosphoglycerate mutase
MLNLLGEVVARAGMKQLRIAETQKFRHVTSFFNGKRMEPSDGEDRVEIEGTWDPSEYAQHPEMDAPRVAARTVELVQSGQYDMIVLNFANCDMVGHTGVMDATMHAVEVVDDCVGQVVRAVLATGGAVLLTADHGNAEQMADPATGKAKTAHTINPVSLVYIADDAPNVRLLPHGKLADIAPTMLHLLGLEAPADMTAENLIV